MSKKQLYIFILPLGAVVLYLLFVPLEKPVVTAPEETTEAITSSITTPVVEEVVPVITESETVTVEGLFLSLAEEKTEFQKSFFYLMLDDGTEVVRIDLRPLLGYSVIDPIGKLGVDRGMQVVISGVMTDDGFKIKAITPATE